MLESGFDPSSSPPAMPMLPARHYVSEHTQFIRDLLANQPQLEGEQRTGRAIWWDKVPSELELRREMDEGLVAQPAYVYFDAED
jgi:hypothetical protein